LDKLVHSIISHLYIPLQIYNANQEQKQNVFKSGFVFFYS